MLIHASWNNQTIFHGFSNYKLIINLFLITFPIFSLFGPWTLFGKCQKEATVTVAVHIQYRVQTRLAIIGAQIVVGVLMASVTLIYHVMSFQMPNLISNMIQFFKPLIVHCSSSMKKRLFATKNLYC